MKFYDILLKLSGQSGNSVRKGDLPAPEVMLLNEIHGGENIKELTERREVEFTASDHRRLRAKLGAKYNVAAHPKNRAAMERLFGQQRTAPLPESVTEEDLVPDRLTDEDLDDDPIEEPAKVTAAEPPPADPKDAIKASLKALGVPVPKGNASTETLRKALAEAQQARADAEAAKAAEAQQPETVL